jgi:ATP-dependent DNA ligase
MRFAPVLCTPFVAGRLTFPCHVQPKLNGFRAVYKDGMFHSRNGHRWHEPVFEHILAPLRTALGSDVILDGEFYRHGWELERIAEAISLMRRTPAADTFEIGFYVFDAPAELPFLERSRRCVELVSCARSRHVRPVPTARIGSREDADALYALHLKAGFEGSIYRCGSGGYRPGRCRLTMKRKPRPGSGFKTPREFQRREPVW